MDKLAKRLRRSGQSVLAQQSPLRILSNVTVTEVSLELLREALAELMTQTTDGPEGKSKKAEIEGSITLENLAYSASPPP